MGNVAVRRRLFLPVAPRRAVCPSCLKGRVDPKGEHQVTCGGRGGLIMRHNCIRDLLRQELQNAGLKVEIERNAGSEDKSKPGDLKVLKWERGLDLYIDVSCINPKTDLWKSHLVEGGVGAAAVACEKKKKLKYKGNIDERTGTFLPFIMEVQEGIGKAAADFILQAEKLIRQKFCDMGEAPTSVANISLMTSLSIELQRFNSEMILQRQPLDKALEVSESDKVESAKQAAVIAARKALLDQDPKQQENKKNPEDSTASICIYPATENLTLNNEGSCGPHVSTIQEPERPVDQTGAQNSKCVVPWRDIDSEDDIDFSNDPDKPLPFPFCGGQYVSESRTGAARPTSSSRQNFKQCRCPSLDSPRLSKNENQAGKLYDRETKAVQKNLDIGAHNSIIVDESLLLYEDAKHRLKRNSET